MIKVRYQITADDYVAAQRLHLRKAWGKKVVWPIVVLVITALLYAWSLFHPSPQLLGQIRPMGYLSLGLLMAAVLIWSGVIFRQQFRKIPSLQLPFEMEAGPEGINTLAASGHGLRRWNGFEDFRESKTSFLFYMQRNLFFIVPKRVLSSAEISELRELAHTHIKTP